MRTTHRPNRRLVRGLAAGLILGGVLVLLVPGFAAASSGAATIAEYQGIGPNSTVGNVVAGPGQDTWFTEFGAAAIGEVGSSGEVTQVSSGLSAQSAAGLHRPGT